MLPTLKLSMQTNKFLVMWDNQGLECVLDISTYERELVWAKLSDTQPPSLPIREMMMRARTNAHRCYEIYTITVEHNISVADMTDMFGDNPQAVVNLIRERGTAIYSDRAKSAPVIV